jgi:hypothetical protein
MFRLRILAGLVFLAVLPALAWSQEEPVQFAVAESHPTLAARLGLGERLSFRLTYRSSLAVVFQVEGYAAGRKVGAGTMSPPLAGRGEALVWIEFREPTAIDEIRIRAANGRWWWETTRASISLPMQVEWRGRGWTAGPTPEWVEILDREQREQQNRALEQQNRALGDALLITVMVIDVLGVLGYLVAQSLLIWRWSGGWRIAALVPLVGTVLAFIYWWPGADARVSPISVVLFMLYLPIPFLCLMVLVGIRRMARM